MRRAGGSWSAWHKLPRGQLRIELAEGHLREADKELGIGEWRAASASSQMDTLAARSLNGKLMRLALLIQ